MDRLRLLLLFVIMGSIFGTPIASADVGFDVQIGPPRFPVHEYVPFQENSVWIPGYWVWQRGERVWEEGHWELEQRNYYVATPRDDHRWYHEHEDNDDEDDD